MMGYDIREVLPEVFRIPVPLEGNPLKELNSYLFRGSREAKQRNLLVDTGFRTEGCKKALLKGLGQLGVSMEDTDILLTHLHADHSGNAPELIRPGGIYAVLHQLQDPGNAGTIIRTGEGAGVSGVFLTKTCVDITNPKVIRATMGSVYRIPFLYVEDVVSLKQQLQDRGIRFFAAHLQGKNSYDREDYKGGTAFLIGNEGKGLTDQAAEAADCLIRIPMCGQVESLNAAMAAGILMYEAARQRRN